MPRTTYCSQQTYIREVSTVENKTIVLPFDQTRYAALIDNREAYKAHIQALFTQYPELFPAAMSKGWILYGMTRTSAKQSLKLRRIQTTEDQEVYQIRPAFVMPYMTCETQTAERIVFLAQW
jgi:hypothetical protein